MIRKGLIISLCLAAWVTSCEEIGPEINPGGGVPIDTSGQQQRIVLLEEFTGVRCVNCPAASTFIEELKNIYGDRLVVMAIHAGIFSFPYPESQHDFRTSDGDNIQSLLGEPVGYPSGVVNRKQFPDEPSLQLGQAQWAGYIAQEAAEPPLVLLDIEKTLNPATNLLTVTLSIVPTADISAPDVRYNLALTESNIQDVQLAPQGKVMDYTHKRVFRTMLTAFDGNLVTEPLLAGDTITKTVAGTLDAGWSPENCRIIGFVNLGGENKDVLQAIEVPVVD